jgi:hypothetical protein
MNIKKLLTYVACAIAFCEAAPADRHKVVEITSKVSNYLLSVQSFANANNESRMQGAFTTCYHDIANTLLPAEYEKVWNYPGAVANRANAGAAIVECTRVLRKYQVESTLSSNSLTPLYTPAEQTIIKADADQELNAILATINDKQKRIQDGQAYGTAIGTFIKNKIDVDGHKDNIRTYYGTIPYQPGKWSSTASFDGHTICDGITIVINPNTNLPDACNGGAIYANWPNVTTIGMNHPSDLYVPPREAHDSPIMLAGYEVSRVYGDVSNKYKLRDASFEEDMIIAATGPSFTLAWTVSLQLAEDLTSLSDQARIRLIALTGLFAHDVVVWNWYWKEVYQADRPAQRLFNGGDGVTADPTYQLLRNGALNPDYPAGHPAMTTGLGEIQRLALVEAGLIEAGSDILPEAVGAVRAYIPKTKVFTKPRILQDSKPIIFGNFAQVANRVSQGRLSMHTAAGIRQGQISGTELANYIYARNMRPLA